jgi:hypothetical protein
LIPESIHSASSGSGAATLCGERNQATRRQLAK